MKTPWGEALDPEHVLPEHPRPQLVREGWLTLNGTWEHAFTDAGRWSHPTTWDGPILVPFSPEAPLSGVGRTLQAGRGALVPADGSGARRAGRRRGCCCTSGRSTRTARSGSTGSRWAATGAATCRSRWTSPTTLTGAADHELVVRVVDVTDTTFRSRGKQKLEPGGIWYTAQSGIWQTVWLEAVPEQHVERLVLTPDLAAGEVEVIVVSSGEVARVRVSAEGREVAAGTCRSAYRSGCGSATSGRGRPRTRSSTTWRWCSARTG